MKLSGYAKDITGQRFGRLTAIEPVYKNKHNAICWRCKCDCGNENYITTASCLINGRKTGCGCKAKNKKPAKIVKSLCLDCKTPLCEWLKSKPSDATADHFRAHGMVIEKQSRARGDASKTYDCVYIVQQCPWHIGG